MKPIPSSAHRCLCSLMLVPRTTPSRRKRRSNPWLISTAQPSTSLQITKDAETRKVMSLLSFASSRFSFSHSGRVQSCYPCIEFLTRTESASSSLLTVPISWYSPSITLCRRLFSTKKDLDFAQISTSEICSF